MYYYKLAKQKKKSRFFSPFSHLFIYSLRSNKIERCSLAASYFYSFIFFFVCLVICLVVSILASFFLFLCLITDENRNNLNSTLSFSSSFVLILNYRITCFHTNIQQLSISMLLFFFLSFGKAICSFLSIFVCFCCPFQLVYEGWCQCLFHNVFYIFIKTLTNKMNKKNKPNKRIVLINKLWSVMSFQN